jgi:hypothetical protein
MTAHRTSVNFRHVVATSPRACSQIALASYAKPASWRLGAAAGTSSPPTAAVSCVCWRRSTLGRNAGRSAPPARGRTTSQATLRLLQLRTARTSHSSGHKRLARELDNQPAVSTSNRGQSSSVGHRQSAAASSQLFTSRERSIKASTSGSFRSAISRSRWETAPRPFDAVSNSLTSLRLRPARCPAPMTASVRRMSGE